MNPWMTPPQEAAATRRAAARVGAVVREQRLVQTAHGVRVASDVRCRNGWHAAQFLVSLAAENGKSDGARALAAELRARSGPSDAAYVALVHDFVRKGVRFVREPGEIFPGGSFTLASGGGDCDDHALLIFALLAAGGVVPAMAFMYKPTDPSGPTHVVSLARLDGRWVWLETTIAARVGEHPYAAVQRLGIKGNREDIASEVKIMSESDLPPVPAGFDAANDPMVREDGAALAKLGFLCSTLPYGGSASDDAFRTAVAAFQRSRSGLVVDGLIGPKTRAEVGKAMAALGQPYANAAPPPRLYLHSQARAALAAAYASLFGKDATAGELDFGLAVALGETAYGRAGAANWANPGQFAKWASEGLYNWGALERGTPTAGVCPQISEYHGVYPKLPSVPVAVVRAGVDAGRPSCFLLFDSDERAAGAFLRAWGSPDTLAAAATGSATAVAASMKRHGYYEGFWRPPGGLDANHPASKGFKEAASAEEAEAKNIADYAALISRGLAAVRGPGGVPDPSPSPSGKLAGAIGGVALVVGAAAAIAHWIGRSL